jgi:hypothetical protein
LQKSVKALNIDSGPGLLVKKRPRRNGELLELCSSPNNHAQKCRLAVLLADRKS